MKPTGFVALLVAAVVSLAVALTAYVASRPFTIAGNGSEQPMLPALKTSAGDVAAIEVVQGSQSVKLANKAGTWVLASHEDYPANVEAARALLVAASEASLIERKTAKTDLFALLGLVDPKASTSNARLIRFLDKSGAPIAEIIAGNQKTDAFGASKTGTYVRRPGEDQTWLANRAINGSAKLGDWVKTRVVDVPTDSVKSASVEVAGQPAYAIDRDSDGQTHKLAPMPAGKKLKYVNAIDEIIESASYVDFTDVRKAGKSDALPSAGTLSFETDSGLKVKLDVRANASEAWVRITPSGEGSAKKASDDMAALVNGWEYQIPVSKVSSLFKKQADLLEDAAS